MYKEIAINGKYMCKKECRGVQRYTKEVLHALDEQVEPGLVKVIVPHKTISIDKFKNIEVVKFGGFLTSKLWQILGFQLYIWTHSAFSICLSDGVPFFGIGIAAIHDVRFLEDLKKKNTLKARIGLIFSKMTFRNAIEHAKSIVTVSNFSKNQIEDKFNLDEKNKVFVAYNSWQHLRRIKIDESIFERNPEIEKGEYYFSLGGTEESKNMVWILHMVEKYPDRQFLMAGPRNLYFPTEGVDLTKFKNFKHLGYVTDSEMKTLMKNAKAFLFPSKYEGFGIPPMEAISVGTPAIISNAACLPEVYKSYVAYFSPDDYDADLDVLLEKAPDNYEGVLELYSWDKTAKSILNVAKKYIK